ncbi:MAG: dephospho-CoA kinase [Eubacteriales bacterium]|nr:dephospho-CoA kinase [Eubacteriales bacterium]
MLVIGITGGIGSGKSTLSEYYKEKGYPVLDVDEISRAVTRAGGASIPSIRKAFGGSMILPDGSLDRKKMADLVFSDDEARKKLENIVVGEATRQIVDAIERYRASGKYDIIFLDAPTLFENGGDRLTDQVWLVTADAEIRIARVMARDGSSREQVLARMRKQLPEEEKIRRADQVLYNNEGREEFLRKAEELIKNVFETTGREKNK